MTLKEVAEVFYCTAKKTLIKNSCKWLEVSNFVNGEVLKAKEGIYYELSGAVNLQKNDIVLKRINPQFVNLFEIEDSDYFVGANLIVVRCKNNINPHYLEMLLSLRLQTLLKDLQNGAHIMAVNRVVLENFDLGNLPSLDKQIMLSSLWKLKEKKDKLTIDLHNKEKKLLSTKILKIIKGEN